ncbi:hypothetical protein ACMATS_05835 [Streptoverticillium reticulum]|uniref:hypothetical protein n=1 Tax=Streptoverticillium reticulum TaxID=1433415 RepID=UPI0039BF16FB
MTAPPEQAAVIPDVVPDGFLGCAQDYVARLHYRCNSQPYTSPVMDAGVTRIRWSRSLNEPGECEVVVAKSSLSPACCDALGTAATVRLELNIYRDGELVWVGPLVRRRETPTEFVLYAQDVLWWLSKIANLLPFAHKQICGETDTIPFRPSRCQIEDIAANVLRAALFDPEPCCNCDPPKWMPDWKCTDPCPCDWPCLHPFLYAERNEDYPERPKWPVIQFSMGGEWQNYTAYVDEIWRELAAYGMHWTAIGRRIIIMKPRTDNDRHYQPRALITDDDIQGDLEINEDASNAATHAHAWSWAKIRCDTRQEHPDGIKGVCCYTAKIAPCCQPDGTPAGCQPYGRVDVIVRVENELAGHQELRTAALMALGGRYPAPLTITFPEGTRLRPEFRVAINKLIPGERYDVNLNRHCAPIRQGFRLTEVTVEWDGQHESVGIALAPLHRSALVTAATTPSPCTDCGEAP